MSDSREFGGKFVIRITFYSSAFLNNQRDGFLGDLKSKLAASPICQHTVNHIYHILGLVLTNLEPLCIGDSTRDMIM